MTQNDLLIEYRRHLELIRNRAKENNISDQKFYSIVRQINNTAQTKCKSSKTVKVLKVVLVTFALVIFMYIVLNVHQPTSSLVLRNIQNLIYPGLKIWRYFAVPIIKKFPSLTELYDETCLLENPYFYVADMECWPCERVYSVIDITNFDNYSLYQSGIPYIAKTNQVPIYLEDLKLMYQLNRTVFDRDASKIWSSNATLKHVKELFEYKPNENSSSNLHVLWRINRMVPGRIIRNKFPRPFIVPQWAGQSTEKFILIDEIKAPAYLLPNPDCSYVFVIQASGERTIVLKPSRECGHLCKTVSVVLKPSDMLWYNWWYWRPISLPFNKAKNTSISYMSSYC